MIVHIPLAKAGGDGAAGSEDSPGAFLGRRLQRARVKAGFASQEALAARLHIDRTVIAKAESGERPPTPDLLATWCDLTGIADPDMYGDLCDLARTLNGAIPQWFKPWLDAEALATSLRIWHPLIMPGLFQTQRYAEEIIGGLRPQRRRRAGGGAS